VLFDSSEEQHRLGGHIKRVYNLICHGQNVTAPDGCLRHTDQLSR
jgi:hypothetical protein